jgi:hypothetical protein
MTTSGKVRADPDEPAARPEAAGKRRSLLAADRHRADRIVATVVFLIASVLAVQSFRYGLFEDGRPGAGLFPMIVAVGLAIAAACWIVQGAGAPPATEIRAAADGDRAHVLDAVDQVHGRPSTAAELDEAMGDRVVIERAGALRIAFVVAWTVVPLLMLEPLGYLITLTVYVAGLLIVLARTRIWLALPGAAAGSVLTAWGADALGIVLPDPYLLLQRLGL